MQHEISHKIIYINILLYYYPDVSVEHITVINVITLSQPVLMEISWFWSQHVMNAEQQTRKPTGGAFTCSSSSAFGGLRAHLYPQYCFFPLGNTLPALVIFSSRFLRGVPR